MKVCTKATEGTQVARRGATVDARTMAGFTGPGGGGAACCGGGMPPGTLGS